MGFEIMARACDQCLVTPARIVSGARAAQLTREVRRKDCAFICHKSPPGREIACRGMEDRVGPSQMHRIAGRLGMIEEVDPEALARKEP